MMSHTYKPPTIHFAWLCDNGLVRTVNEDALLVQKRSSVLSEGYQTGASEVELSSDPLFLGVADSRGAGEDILRNIANAVFSTESPRTGAELREIIQNANRYQSDESNRRVNSRAIGAPLTVALVDDRQATIAQTGDTRCYLYRSDNLYRVTVDRSLVEQLIRSGQITAEEAQPQPQSTVSISTLVFRDKDWLLLLTDGIWRLVDGELIAETVREANSPLAVVTRLKSRAIKNGGHDSLSVIAAQASIP
jgi:serine/threonine protein phosphatase PrpC